jgi:hypothetical protein
LTLKIDCAKEYSLVVLMTIPVPEGEITPI